MVGYAVKFEEAPVSFVVSSTFMLGIWHKGDLLEKIKIKIKINNK